MSAVRLSETYRPERHELGAVYMYQSPRQAFLGLCDPVLQVDHFFMSYPFFAPHPHAGFSAVTYMLENSRGGFVNRDSLGDRSLINAGDLHWTWAGSGLVHEEVPRQPGVLCHGLQIFVNMSDALRALAPQVFHLACAEQPKADWDGVRLKVVVGACRGVRSPVQTPDPFSLLDLKFGEDTSFELAVEAGWGGLCLAIEGAFSVRSEAEERRLAANETVAFGSEGPGLLTLRAETFGTMIVLTGRQLKEPIVAGGPFVQGSSEALANAMTRFQNGAMGSLTRSF